MSNLIIKKSSYEFDGSLKLANEKLNADQAPRVTFWGTRIVKFDGQDISLNDIAKKVSAISHLLYEDIGSNKQSSSLTLEDRISGIEIGKKLINYHKLTDEQIKNSNFITRFFAWIRGSNSAPFSENNPLEMGVFRLYTPKNFLSQFGGLVVNSTHIAADGFSKSFGCVIAKEEAMRAQLEKEKAAPGLGITTRVFSYVTNICSYPLYLLNLQKN